MIGYESLSKMDVELIDDDSESKSDNVSIDSEGRWIWLIYSL